MPPEIFVPEAASPAIQADKIAEGTLTLQQRLDRAYHLIVLRGLPPHELPADVTEGLDLDTAARHLATLSDDICKRCVISKVHRDVLSHVLRQL